ncbi:MAG: agmatinase [Rubrobacteridae bacterium]|nr:agmatinase [Rubrobacteridae bacterium]
MYEVIPFNFLGIEEHSDFEESKVVVIPVGYDSTTSFRGGTREAPTAIMNASRQVELYDEELEIEVYDKIGIHTFKEILPHMAGPSYQIEQVNKVVLDILNEGKFPVMIGGEHSLTLGAVQAVKNHHPDVSVLHFDAHTDFREEYEGTPYSHACVMKRIHDEGITIAQIGIRNTSKEESKFIKSNNIFSVAARQYKYGYYSVEDIVEALTDTVYISIDMDVFDPSEVPAVGTPEPGGLTWYEVLDILQEVTFHKKVVGFDVVELCPIPGNPASDFFAAKLIYKLIGYCFRGEL